MKNIKQFIKLRLMATILKRIQNKLKAFNDKQQYQTSYPFNIEDVKSYVIQNRKSLSHFDRWWDDVMLNNSVFRYGITDNILDKLNMPIGEEPTYSDMMCYFADKIGNNISYLETGVSVGKNLYQLLNAFDKAKLTGFDIEEINPYLSAKLNMGERTEWATWNDSIKKTPSSLTSYTYKSNKLDYICADEWDKNSWEKMAGKKFNIIFSDALHDPEALLFEFDMIEKHGLLDEGKFVMVWDDLGGEMIDSFLKIKKRLAKTRGIGKKNTYIININGWIGSHWGKHNVGIITNIIE